MLSPQGRGEPVIRLGEIVMILDLHRQGANVSTIARRTGLDRKTVRKVIASGLEPPVYGPRPPRVTLLQRGMATRVFKGCRRKRLPIFVSGADDAFQTSFERPAPHSPSASSGHELARVRRIPAQ